MPDGSAGATEGSGAGFAVMASVINDRARELVLADRWSEAQRFLVRCLPGIRVEDCYRIMRGETRLVNVGRNEVAYAEDAGEPRRLAGDEEYVAALDLKWCAIVRTRFGHHVPYAWVSDYGIKDIDNEQDFVAQGRYLISSGEPGTMPSQGTWRANGREYLARPLHYLEDKANDIAVEMDVSRIPELLAEASGRTLPILFRKVPEPPPWIEAARNPADAVVEWFRRGMSLRRTGYSVVSGDRGLGAFSPSVDAPPPARTRQEEAKAEAEDRAAEAREERDMRDRCEAARAAVVAQADAQGPDGWMEIVAGERRLRVPRAPFEHWALRRCGADHLAPPWKTCSVPGMKAGMSHGDDPLHTDWMLGAGLDVRIDHWYGPKADGELVAAALDALGAVQLERLGFPCNVLAGTGSATGRAFVATHGRKDLPEPGDILVLPDSTPQWLEHVLAACADGQGAVIVARGGALAHLVVEARVSGCRIVRVPGAAMVYVEGQTVRVDCDRGTAEILPFDLDDRPEGGRPIGWNR